MTCLFNLACRSGQCQSSCRLGWWIELIGTNGLSHSALTGSVRRWVWSGRDEDTLTPLNLRQWFSLNWWTPCLERSQLTWFKHLVRMLSGCLLWKVLQAFPPGRRTWGRHRFRWKIISLPGNDWGKGKGSPGPHVVTATSATWHWIRSWRQEIKD